MVFIQERANAFLDALDRPFPKKLLWAWGIIAAWDTFVSQFIPEEIAKKFPKAHQVVTMTYGWLSLQTWLLIGAILVALISLEWGTRHKRKLELATGAVRQQFDIERPLLVAFWMFVSALTITIWSLHASHWTAALKSVSPELPPQSPTTTPAPPPSPPPAPTQASPVPVPQPKPAPPPPKPWVSSDNQDKQKKLGRILLVYSPSEIIAMYANGQDISIFVGKWIRIEGSTINVPVETKLQNKDYYVIGVQLGPIDMFNRANIAAFFDSKNMATYFFR
jgi:hypothetical protein